MNALLAAPFFVALAWLGLRLALPTRLRPGGWLPASAAAFAVGIGVALYQLAAEVSGREEEKITPDLLYDAIGLASAALGAGLAAAVLVLVGEIGLRGRRPVSAPGAAMPWLAGLVALGLDAWAGQRAWAVITKAGETALLLEQRKAGLVARAVDLRSLATALFASGVGATLALVVALVGLAAVFGSRPEAVEPARPARR